MMENSEINLVYELVEKAQSGDRGSFSKIVRLMMNQIFALTYKMTGDKETASDMLQDTFVTAWEKLGSFKGDSKFESWVYRIAVNKCLNVLKRESRNQPLEVDNLISIENPERDHYQRELKLNILSFMSSLPAQQKVVFELHFYKEMTFEEITKITGKALGTVKTLYREAVIKLRNTAKKKGWYSEL